MGEDHTQTKEYRRPKLTCIIHNVPVEVILDSGSDVSVIDHYFLQRNNWLDTFPQLPVTGIKITGVTGITGKPVYAELFVQFTIDRYTFQQAMFLVEGLNVPMILGIDWLSDNNVSLNFKNGTVSFPHGQEGDLAVIHFNQSNTSILGLTLITEAILEHNERNQLGADMVQVDETDIRDNINKANNLSISEKEDMITLLCKHIKVFSTRPGVIKDFVCRLKIKPHNPFYVRPYSIPVSMKPLAQKEIDRMLQWNIIEQSDSCYNNPLVVIKKSDGNVRIVLDARTVNRIIEPERDRPPIIEEMLAKFEGVKYISTMDLTAGYWQIALHKDSRRYTAFLFEGRSYQFQVLPFGLNVAVSVFIRALDKAIGTDLRSKVLLYVDDIVVITKTWEEHQQTLDELFTRLGSEGVTIKLSKSQFGRNEVKLLGYIVNTLGIKPDPHRLDAITMCPQPNNRKQLKSYFGMVGYYRKFLPQSVLNAPNLMRLLKQNTVWKWNKNCEEEFLKIKEALSACQLLVHPNFAIPFHMAVDASDYGLGCHIFQEYVTDNKVERKPIAFASRMLTQHERNYGITEKETLSVVWAFKKFKYLLAGNETVVHTDHSALTFLLKSKLQHSRLTRWALFLQEFRFTIEYVKGQDNIIPDALSRLPIGLQTNQDVKERGKFAIYFLKVNTHEKDIKIFCRNLASEQSQDSYLRIYIDALQQSNTDTNDTWKLYKGILFHRKHNSSRWLLCIPQNRINLITWYVHIGYAHFGPKKCILHMNKFYYFKNMNRVVKRILRSCEICQKVKVQTIGVHTALYPIIPNELWDLSAVDFYGLLPSGWEEWSIYL